MASTACSLTPEEFERRFGVETIARFYDDDVAGQASIDLVVGHLAEADAIARGLLMVGFTEGQTVTLMQSDISIRGCAYDIAAGLMGQRRPEFISDGVGPYDGIRTRAERRLKETAAAEERRSVGERQAGANAHAGATQVRPAPRPRVFTYATGRPKGGF